MVTTQFQDLASSKPSRMYIINILSIQLNCMIFFNIGISMLSTFLITLEHAVVFSISNSFLLRVHYHKDFWIYDDFLALLRSAQFLVGSTICSECSPLINFLVYIDLFLYILFYIIICFG